MTGSTWLDVAIVALFVVVFAWWIRTQLRAWTRTRTILRYTLDSVKREAEEDARHAAAASPAATPEDGRAKQPAGPWNRTPPQQ